MGKETQTAKNTKNDCFHNFEHSSLLILIKNQKKLGTQIHVALLSFHAVLT